MSRKEDGTSELENLLRKSEERLRLGEAAAGIATFEFDTRSGAWSWSPQARLLFGIEDGATSEERSASWQKMVFVDDLPKIHAAIDTAGNEGRFYAEFRVRHPDGSLHWIAGKGNVSADSVAIRGAAYEITDRKALEVRLLALNETLEARVAEVREEAHALEVLERIHFNPVHSRMR